jgi:hypothetical protein
MIPFNWSHLISQARHSVIRTRGTHLRLTPHRRRVLAVFWVLFVPHQIFTRLCLILDNVFFPAWKKTAVVKPLFITGLFRSGTTFLHRLLAEDDKTFSAFKTWEIYLAPSITQRKILKAWKVIDRLLGSPAMKWLDRYDSRRLGEIRFHQVGLWKEEEDEGLLLYLWDSLFTWFFFPDKAGIRDFAFAGGEMSPGRQRRKLKFYKECIQRHLYCHPGASVYLSKNPAFTPKLASLKEAFPDARIVYMVRDPAEVLVSQAAWFSFCWHYFASPTETYPFRDFLREMTIHWYRYPLSLLDRWPSQDYLIVEYRNLITRPVETILRLYDHFRLEMDDGFKTRLTVRSRQTGEYTSGQRLSPEEIGYEPEVIRDDFAEVYRRFDFSDE